MPSTHLDFKVKTKRPYLDIFLIMIPEYAERLLVFFNLPCVTLWVILVVAMTISKSTERGPTQALLQEVFFSFSVKKEADYL